MKTVNIFFLVRILDDINLAPATVAREISDILNDPRGWPRIYRKQDIDLHFYYISSDTEYSKIPKGHRMTIYFAYNETVTKVCEFSGLSCAIFDSNTIYFNYENWINPPRASKLNIEEYHYYVVQHEVGHLLGRKEHHTCKMSKDGRSPIMMQQTKGQQGCTKNLFPLDWE